MLVLSRRKSQRIIIGGDIVVTIADICGRKVRVGVKAPANIAIHREEVCERIPPETKTSNHRVKQPCSERMVYSELDDGPNALIRSETSKGPCGDGVLPRFEVWVMFDGYVDRQQAEKVAERIAAKEIVVDEITGDMRKVIEWAWMNPDSPPEIHDTAARLLQQPSLAHGFAT